MLSLSTQNLAQKNWGIGVPEAINIVEYSKNQVKIEKKLVPPPPQTNGKEREGRGNHFGFLVKPGSKGLSNQTE